MENMITLFAVLLFLILAAESAYDGYTTQYLLSLGYGEADPLARPFVTQGFWGQVAACVLGVGVVVALFFLLKHFGHPVSGLVTTAIAVVGEGINCIRQSKIMKQAVTK